MPANLLATVMTLNARLRRALHWMRDGMQRFEVAVRPAGELRQQSSPEWLLLLSAARLETVNHVPPAARRTRVRSYNQRAGSFAAG